MVESGPRAGCGVSEGRSEATAGRPPLHAAARRTLVAAGAAAFLFAALSPTMVLEDSATYLAPARSLAAGEGLRDTDGSPLQSRLPLYPLLLGAVVWAFGAAPGAISLLNATLHVGSVLLVRRPLRPLAPALVDAVSAIALVYPPLVTSTALVLQESLVAFTLALVFVTAWRAFSAPSPTRSLLAGAALGLSGLAKVTALPLIVPLAVGLALVTRSRVAHAALVVAGTALVLLPWATRNAMVLGRFEVTNSNGGITLLGGTVSNTITDWYAFPEYLAAREEWESGAREEHPLLDRYLYGVALRRIAADPGRWLVLVSERTVRFMLPSRVWFARVGLSRMGTLGPVYALGVACQGVLFGATALLAVIALRRPGPPRLWIAPAIVFGHMAVYAVFYASPRYGVSVGPVLFGALAILLSMRGGGLGPGPTAPGATSPRPPG